MSARSGRACRCKLAGQATNALGLQSLIGAFYDVPTPIISATSNKHLWSGRARLDVCGEGPPAGVHPICERNASVRKTKC